VSENILELRKITKRFSRVVVLREVSFALAPGEIHALLFENGAGKSTLVKVITGVHQPDGGEILLSGKHVYFGDPRASRQAGIAAIYRELSLFPIGRTFLINARILIMNEPTSSLTLNEVTDLFRLVRRLRDDGAAIIFISRRLEELFEIADRVTVLRAGAFVDTRLLKEVEAGDVVLKVENLSHGGMFENVSFELRRGEILRMTGLFGAAAPTWRAPCSAWNRPLWAGFRWRAGKSWYPQGPASFCFGPAR
jgi:ABC-type sugar transport system ATPase subunit